MTHAEKRLIMDTAAKLAALEAQVALMAELLTAVASKKRGRPPVAEVVHIETLQAQLHVD